jgi:hypothetical protein
VFLGHKHESLPLIYKKQFQCLDGMRFFGFWFECEFMSSIRCHLHSKEHEEKAFLLLDHCPAHPAEVLKSKDGKIRAMFLPKNSTALIQPMDQDIIEPLKPTITVNYLVEL